MILILTARNVSQGYLIDHTCTIVEQVLVHLTLYIKNFTENEPFSHYFESMTTVKKKLSFEEKTEKFIFAALRPWEHRFPCVQCV